MVKKDGLILEKNLSSQEITCGFSKFKKVLVGFLKNIAYFFIISRKKIKSYT